MFKKNTSKKLTTLAITGALSILMASSVMAAPGGFGGGPQGGQGFGGGPQGGGMMQEMQRPDGEMPEFNEGERPELPEGELPELPEGEMPEKPEGELQEGEMTEGERSELPEGEEEKMPGMKGDRGGFAKGIDTEAISESIDALEDDDTKESLTELLSAYEDAKSALDSAIESEDEDIDSYREAEMTAMKALFDALEEAGIDTKPAKPEGDATEMSESERPELSESEMSELPKENERRESFQNTEGAQQNATAQQSGESQQKNSEGVISKIANWFKSLFAR
ncbi:MAG: hypothetical protein IJ591_06520 [Lachnospiraceae bacterium]|nr:hypothetical protein [Lachnospiraceae bacterium]